MSNFNIINHYQASTFLQPKSNYRQKRDNAGVLEEIRQDPDFTRECLEERCDVKELNEIATFQWKNIKDQSTNQLNQKEFTAKIRDSLLNRCFYTWTYEKNATCSSYGTSTCVNDYNSFVCECKDGFMGKKCNMCMVKIMNPDNPESETQDDVNQIDSNNNQIQNVIPQNCSESSQICDPKNFKCVDCLTFNNLDPDFYSCNLNTNEYGFDNTCNCLCNNYPKFTYEKFGGPCNVCKDSQRICQNFELCAELKTDMIYIQNENGTSSFEETSTIFNEDSSSKQYTCQSCYELSGNSSDDFICENVDEQCICKEKSIIDQNSSSNSASNSDDNNNFNNPGVNINDTGIIAVTVMTELSPDNNMSQETSKITGQSQKSSQSNTDSTNSQAGSGSSNVIMLSCGAAVILAIIIWIIYMVSKEKKKNEERDKSTSDVEQPLNGNSNNNNNSDLKNEYEEAHDNKRKEKILNV